MSEKMMAKLNEIEMKCLYSNIRSHASGVIELKHFKTFIEIIAPISKKANLRFDGSSQSQASNPSANAITDAFLPRSLFSRYVELGEIDRLCQMFDLALSFLFY